MADDHAEHGHPAQAASKPVPSGDKISNEFEDFVVKPGLAVGLGYLAYKYLGALGALAGPGFVGGAAAENLAKKGNINIPSGKILEEMVTGTAMSGVGAWGMNAAQKLPQLGGAISALGHSAASGSLAAAAALGVGASLVAPLIYFPLSYAISNGKLEGIGKDLKNNYLKGLRTIPISMLGMGAAYAGIFTMAPYVAIPAALYLMAGYRTALSRENWGYMKAVGMSFAAPVAAAGTLGSYLLIGVPLTAALLAYSVINKGISLYYNATQAARDMLDSFGKQLSKPLGAPVPRGARAQAAAPSHAGGH